jgi:hypothetical protein
VSALETYGLILAAGVFVVTLVLIRGHWSELSGPVRGDSPVEIAHYRHQSARRRLMSTLMISQAVLILLGSTVRHEVDGRPNPLFILIWLTVCVLVVVLLVLAAIDWLMIQKFARWMRVEIVRGGVEALKAGLKEGERSDGLHNGRNGVNSAN